MLGLDAKGLTIATDGWMEESPQQLLEFALEASKLPIAGIVYTDISKDGMMAGPNIERTKMLIDTVDVPVIASGGVSTVSDIIELVKIKPEAAIVGRSLYEGTLKLADAINAAKEQT